MKKFFQLFFLATFTAVFAHAFEQPPSSEYRLLTGEADLPRSDEQSTRLMPLTTKHLIEAGLKPGMTVWDWACGAGFMTLWLAEQVGNDGHVFAVDGDEKQLKLAQALIEKNGLASRVTFIQANLLTDEVRSHAQFIENSADLVFARFIHMHLKNPIHSMQLIKYLLKPQGKVVAEEPINREAKCPPYADLLKEYTFIMSTAASMAGQDYNFGDQLRDYLEQCGLIIEVDNIMPQVCTIADLRAHYQNLKPTMLHLHNNMPQFLTNEHLAKWEEWANRSDGEGIECERGSVRCVTGMKAMPEL